MQTKAVREYGIVANFHCPSTSGTPPGVIVIGGAGGGLGSTSAVGSLLAEQGYADLSNSARRSTTFLVVIPAENASESPKSSVLSGDFTYLFDVLLRNVGWEKTFSPTSDALERSDSGSIIQRSGQN